MGKKKLKRFKEVETFSNVFQPKYDEILNKDFKLKGKWNSLYFKNNNPIILELGCGKGEYTLSLAQMFPDKNFIGIDIKGARMWRGAKTANENNINNLVFIRTRVEFINSFFSKNEIDEIWITFPDPQLKKYRTKKRLTSSRFLNSYKNIIKNNGIVHLKTDNKLLYEYTLAIINKNELNILENTNDLYKSNIFDEILSIKTFYELQYLEKGQNIHYIKFQLNSSSPIVEPDTVYGI